MLNRVALAFVFVTAGCASSLSSDRERLAASSVEQVQQLAGEVESWVSAGEVVGAELLVIRRDEVLLHDAWGWADRERELPMVKNGVISVKSMTKPVMATAVLMLVDDGALALDNRLQEFVPEWAGDPRVTLRDLLAQTSGDVGGHGGGGYNVYDFNSLESWVKDWAVQESAGTYGQFAHSNFNYAALGYVVEIVTGAPVEQFLEERIFQPLGMTETWPMFEPTKTWAERVPVRYRLSRETGMYESFWTNAERQPWAFFPAGFGLWMTGLDYAKFLQLWLDGGRHDGEILLSRAMVEEAHKLQGAGGDGSFYGYGWYVDEAKLSDGRPSGFRHGGADGSVGMAFPADDAIVIYLTQSQSPFHQRAFHNRLHMSGLFNHPGPNMDWAFGHELGEHELGREEGSIYLGAYHDLGSQSPTMVTQITEESGRLTIQRGLEGQLAGVKFHLVPLGEHRFSYGRYEDDVLKGIEAGTIVQFNVTEGIVSGLTCHFAGEVEFEGLRTDPAPDSIPNVGR